MLVYFMQKGFAMRPSTSTPNPHCRSTPLNHFLMLLAALTLGACGSDSGNSAQSGNASSIPSQQILSQTAQKGPFSSGAQVTLTRIDEDGAPMADQATTYTEADGSFDAPELSWNGPTMITVTGPYFDEITGTFTTEDRTLRAFPEAIEGKVHTNVNLLTHFLARYLEYWMSEGYDYDGLKANYGLPYLLSFFGITVPPGELNLLDTVNEARVDNSSRTLLLLSAALLDAGLDQAALDRMANDFARSDGEITGDGLNDFRTWMTTLYDDTYTLYHQAHTALQQQYSRTDTPIPVTTVRFSLGSTCQGLSNVLCGESTSLEDLNVPADGLDIQLRPQTTGMYHLSISYDSNLSWRIRDAVSDSVTFPKNGGYFRRLIALGNAGVVKLRGGKRYYLEINNTSDSDVTGVDASLSINSYGLETETVWISDSDGLQNGRAGISIIPGDYNSTRSFYRIQGPAGFYSMTLNSLYCNQYGELGFIATVYQWTGVSGTVPTSSKNAFLDGTVRASITPDDFENCVATIDFTLQGPAAGYIAVNNRRSTLSEYAPGYDEYQLQVDFLGNL
jgi:hypothetical protein